MIHKSRSIAALGLTGALAACVASSADRSAPVAPPAAPPPQAERIRPLHAHMQDHFIRTDLMQKALIAGDLDRVRHEARWLLERPEPPGMPVAWTPFILELIAAAKDVAGAVGPNHLAVGVARMGATCGRCHRALGLDLKLTWDAPPHESMDPRIHMLRHQWATERFWDGLVAADDRGWQAGAGALAEAALHSEDLTEGARIDPHVQAHADTLHALGQSAAAVSATDTDDRVKLYAKLMTTCARCHREAGKGPASPPRLD